jgi:hypothetical protein
MEPLMELSDREALVGSFAMMGVATADELLRLGREALATANWERSCTFFEQASEVARSEALLADRARAHGVDAASRTG